MLDRAVVQPDPVVALGLGAARTGAGSASAVAGYVILAILLGVSGVITSAVVLALMAVVTIAAILTVGARKGGGKSKGSRRGMRGRKRNP